MIAHAMLANPALQEILKYRNIPTFVLFRYQKSGNVLAGTVIDQGKNILPCYKIKIFV